MMELVFRNALGAVINIGKWDELEGLTDAGEPCIKNPLPVDATWAHEEVVTGWDGGTYVLGDPRAEAH